MKVSNKAIFKVKIIIKCHLLILIIVTGGREGRGGLIVIYLKLKDIYFTVA